MCENKRGVSNVIAVTFIILVTIAAVVIVIGVIVPLVIRNTEETQCLPYNDYFSFEEEFNYNCYEVQGDGNIWYAVSVRAKTVDEKLENKTLGLRLAFWDVDGTTTVVDAISGHAIQNADEVGGIRMVIDYANSSTISIPRGSEVVTYVYNSGDKNFIKVDLSPLLEKKKGLKACSVTDSISLINQVCQGVVLEV